MRTTILGLLVVAVALASGCGSGGGTDNAAGGTGGSGGAGTTGGSGGTGGAGGNAGVGGGGPPSCNGLAATCGPGGSASCCASSVVPGGTFYRSYDAVTYTDRSYPATVSDFGLDLYEITVGRFRKFAAGYPGNKPTVGAGKNPNNPADPGWDVAWNASMPADQTALLAALSCDVTFQTWTDSAGGNETRPMNCITWYEAFAFCIWDGGRLPTETEWNYAAAGGSEQRVYPWSNPAISATIDDTYAVYCGGSCSTVQNVGSKSPKGDGKWGQADMAGNLWEWVLDWHATYSNPCNNCANTTTATERVIRGGAFYLDASAQLASWHVSNVPTYRYKGYGARCARALQ